MEVVSAFQALISACGGEWFVHAITTAPIQFFTFMVLVIAISSFIGYRIKDKQLSDKDSELSKVRTDLESKQNEIALIIQQHKTENALTSRQYESQIAQSAIQSSDEINALKQENTKLEADQVKLEAEQVKLKAEQTKIEAQYEKELLTLRQEKDTEINRLQGELIKKEYRIRELQEYEQEDSKRISDLNNKLDEYRGIEFENKNLKEELDRYKNIFDIGKFSVAQLSYMFNCFDAEENRNEKGIYKDPDDPTANYLESEGIFFTNSVKAVGGHYLYSLSPEWRGFIRRNESEIKNILEGSI